MRTLGRPASRLRALAALLVLVGLLPGVVVAQEPVDLTGTWVGMWWMGKYEEPIELDLKQDRAGLVGKVTLAGYPTGSSTAVTPIQAPVAGMIDRDRVELTWTMPAQGQFRAELTVLSQGRLFGAGGVESITTGFDLRRTR